MKVNKDILHFIIATFFIINFISCFSVCAMAGGRSFSYSETSFLDNQASGFNFIKARYIGDIKPLKSIERDYFSPSDRQYFNIAPSKINSHIKKVLGKENFNIVRFDSSHGRILAEKRISPPVKFMLWTWERKSVVFIKMSATHKIQPDILVDVFVLLMEKSPLSKNYTEIDLDENSIELKERIIKSIDETVIKAGGSF